MRGLIFVASLEGGSDVFRDPALQEPNFLTPPESPLTPPNPPNLPPAPQETIFGLAFGADREAKALSLQLLLKLV